MRSPIFSFLHCNSSLLEDGFLKSHTPKQRFQAEISELRHTALILSALQSVDGCKLHFFFQIVTILESCCFVLYVCFDTVLLKLFKFHLHSISSCPSYVWICACRNVTLLACGCWNVALCQQTWYWGTQLLWLVQRGTADLKGKKKICFSFIVISLFFTPCLTWRKFHFDGGAPRFSYHSCQQTWWWWQCYGRWHLTPMKTCQLLSSRIRQLIGMKCRSVWKCKAKHYGLLVANNSWMLKREDEDTEWISVFGFPTMDAMV